MLRVTPMRVGSCRVRPFAAGLAGWRKVDLPALATLIETPNANVLVDCGYGPAFFDATHRFPARAYRIATPVQLPDHEHIMSQLNCRPDLVVLTHMHGDHVAGLMDLPRDVPVCASGAAIAHLATLRGVKATLEACPPILRDGVLARAPQPVEDRDLIETELPEFPQGRDLLGTGEIIAIPLPGHGVGQIGIWMPQTAHFLIADAAYGREALRTGRMPPAFVLHRLGDAARYRDTFARLRRLMGARPDITFLPSHCREVIT